MQKYESHINRIYKETKGEVRGAFEYHEDASCYEVGSTSGWQDTSSWIFESPEIEPFSIPVGDADSDEMHMDIEATFDSLDPVETDHGNVWLTCATVLNEKRGVFEVTPFWECE